MTSSVEGFKALERGQHRRSLIANMINVLDEFCGVCRRDKFIVDEQSGRNCDLFVESGDVDYCGLSHGGDRSESDDSGNKCWNSKCPLQSEQWSPHTI